MPRKFLAFICLLAAAPSAAAQASSQPQVKVNVLNVCAPSADAQKEIASALSHIPKHPEFSPDFEIDRGRSTLEQSPDVLPAGGNTVRTPDSGLATWVRIRHEFSGLAMFSMVQYSFSQDPESMVETLVFRVRDPKDLLELSLEDGASAVTSPSTMLAASTPARRIRLERFGKSSIVLARCSGKEGGAPPDQSAYEPLFQSASVIMSDYRGILGARRTVPEELARMSPPGTTKPKAPANAAPHKPAQPAADK